MNYYLINKSTGRPNGPYSIDELISMINSEQASPSSRISCSEWSEWKALESVLPKLRKSQQKSAQFHSPIDAQCARSKYTLDYKKHKISLTIAAIASVCLIVLFVSLFNSSSTSHNNEVLTGINSNIQKMKELELEREKIKSDLNITKQQIDDSRKSAEMDAIIGGGIVGAAAALTGGAGLALAPIVLDNTYKDADRIEQLVDHYNSLIKRLNQIEIEYNNIRKEID